MSTRKITKETADSLRRMASGQAGLSASEPVVGAPVTSDYLDYIADMILELKTMAEGAQSPQLVRILDIAHHEAARQRQQRRTEHKS